MISHGIGHSKWVGINTPKLLGLLETPGLSVDCCSIGETYRRFTQEKKNVARGVMPKGFSLAGKGYSRSKEVKDGVYAF